MIKNINMNPPLPLNGRNNIERDIKRQFKLAELGIFMSYKCNLNCSYCPHMGVYNKPKDELLDLNLLEKQLPKMVDKFADPNIPIGINISGGEPLLNWDYFTKLTFILSKVHNPVKGRQVTTNLAMDLNVERLKFLAINYDVIHVSLDGKYETQELRSKNTFNSVMKNLITLKSISMSIDNPAYIDISITITEKNVKYLYENIEFFINNNLPISGGLDTTSQFTDDSITEERLKIYAKTFFEQVKRTRKDFNWPEESLKELVLTCNRDQPYTTANILPDGKIYRCPILPVNPIMSLENLKINYNNLESFTEEVGLKYDKHCDTCELKYQCNYCYAATNASRDFYCGMLRATHALDKKYMEIK